MTALLRRAQRDGHTPKDDAAQAPPDEELRAFPELAAAIRSHQASFDTYVRARFLADDAFNPDARSRDVYRKWRSDLLEAYQCQSGRICGSYYCENIIGATARTNRPRFALVFNSHGWGEEEELLTSCDGLYWEGIDYLAGSDRSTFVERLYAVATDVLGLLDTRCGSGVWNGSGDVAGPELRAQALAALERKLQDVRAFYALAAPKRARLRYLAGVAAGFAAGIALAGVLLAVLLVSDLVIAEDRGEIVTIWLAGAVGAVISVMQRVSSDSLVVHHEAGRSELVLLGAIRPLLGGAVAVALYSLFAGGILDFALPPADADTELYYFAGVGFLSGFSERFAQDMLVKSSARLTAAAGVTAPRAVPQPAAPAPAPAAGNGATPQPAQPAPAAAGPPS